MDIVNNVDAASNNICFFVINIIRDYRTGCKKI